MPVRLRLARLGKRNCPVYRIVAMDAKTRRDGKGLENVGLYRATANPAGYKEIELNPDRIKYWLSVGAEPTPPVIKILVMARIIPEKPKELLSYMLPPVLPKQSWLVGKQK